MTIETVSHAIMATREVARAYFTDPKPIPTIGNTAILDFFIREERAARRRNNYHYWLRTEKKEDGLVPATQRRMESLP